MAISKTTLFNLCDQNDFANKSQAYAVFVTVLFFTLVFIAAIFNFANAASQGKLGNRSSASVEISVQINQSLNAISPNEILLNQAKSGHANFKPFCVMHKGYAQNASVPYELKVDALTMPNTIDNTSINNKDTSGFNVYIKDKQSANQIQRLTPGTSILKQSDLRYSAMHQQDCLDSGVQLSLEMSAKAANEMAQGKNNSSGLLILLVSPN